MKKEPQEKRKKPEPEYAEGRDARQNFEKAMKALFRAPKNPKKGKD